MSVLRVYRVLHGGEKKECDCSFIQHVERKEKAEKKKRKDVLSFPFQEEKKKQKAKKKKEKRKPAKVWRTDKKKKLRKGKVRERTDSFYSQNTYTHNVAKRNGNSKQGLTPKLTIA